MFLLCLKVFFARFVDVSLGTVKMMFIVKGRKLISTIIAFVEIIIWFIAAKEAITTSQSSIIVILSYALGYATGTYVGTIINEKFISGVLLLQVISSVLGKKEIEKIKKHQYGVSAVETIDKKLMLFISVEKKQVKECMEYIKSLDQNAFILFNDSKGAFNGYFKK